jgi:hypothetical protein
MGGNLNHGAMNARPIPRTVISRKLERVMGIEYIAGVRLLSANQTVAGKVACCV